ncbi:hypothetical protein [Streptomyces sp. t39]|uniref:hypothetical protein n=1 Tax=Streptomyces sp. t39 TaxID=1828156 RepID=UPI0011CDB486|nr:hypothetical protein [Streptomyces sp. t39]
MATNPTTKKPAAAADESTETITAPAAPALPVPVPAVVGPAPRPGVVPVRVRLSHHLGIDGTDYKPGAEILVSPDYARRWHASASRPRIRRTPARWTPRRRLRRGEGARRTGRGRRGGPGR